MSTLLEMKMKRMISLLEANSNTTSQGIINRNIIIIITINVNKFNIIKTPPGPIRYILGPYSILMIFHGVIQVLKQLPGVLGHQESQKKNEVRKILENMNQK